MLTEIENAALATERYFFEVYGKIDLRGNWLGWKIRGRDLLSPEGDRVNPRRLQGLLFCEALRARIQQTAVRQGVRAETSETFATGCWRALERARAQGV